MSESSRLIATIADDPRWVKPYWLEQQRDPASTSFVSGAFNDELVNRTHRNWTVLGTLSSPERATVDPRGLVTAGGRGWSLDWWIGAEDQWHLPNRTPVVRQRLVGDGPVVETAMRVPGGDALHRAYAIQSTELGPCVVIELENRTAVPYAVALSVRPFDVLGTAAVHSIDVDATGTTVRVNGDVAVLLPKGAVHVAGSTFVDGDCVETIRSGSGRPEWPGALDDPAGAATAAFVFPLTHTAVFRAIIPLAFVGAKGGRRSRSSSDSVTSFVAFPDAVPTAEQVNKGWEAQTRRGLVMSLPDERLMRVVESSRAQLLLAASDSAMVTPCVAFDFASAQTVIQSLDDNGFHTEASAVLRGWTDRQGLDGTFLGGPDRNDANGAALAALGYHWALTRDDELIESLVGPIAKAAHRIDKLATTRRGRRDPESFGLLPAGQGPDYALRSGQTAVLLRDTARSIQGLALIADALDHCGQPEVAEDARRFVARLDVALDRAVAEIDLDSPAVVLAATLELACPLGIYPPAQPGIAAALNALRDRDGVGGGVFRQVGSAGLDPVLTAMLGLAELEAGDERVESRLQWLLDHVTPTGVWPGVEHPRTGGGSAGPPQDPQVTALFLTLVRRMVVREETRGGSTLRRLVLCSFFPTTWLGQSLDVRQAPTAFGLLSFSVRWHGERPALLWELDSHPGVGDVELSAPGLDPTWSTTQASGEALLAAPVRPEPSPEPSVATVASAADGESPVDLRTPSTVSTLSTPAPQPDDSDGPDDSSERGGSFT